MKLSLTLFLSLFVLAGTATQAATHLGGHHSDAVEAFIARFPSYQEQSEKALWYALGNYKESQVPEISQFLINGNPKLVSARNADNKTVLEYVISNHDYSQWTVEALIKQGFVYDQNCLKLAIDYNQNASYIKMLLKTTKLAKYVTVSFVKYESVQGDGSWVYKQSLEHQTIPALDYYLQERKQLREGARSHDILFALSAVAGDTGQIDQEIVKVLTV